MTIDVSGGLLNALIFMGPMAVISGLVCMWLWERTARTKVKVRIIKEAGGVDIHYVVKEGNDITLENKSMGVTRVWPISKLVTIPVPYPDLAGLLPRFLQREIQEITLQEGDWEPVFNRSPHGEKIMSPDSITFVRGLAKKYPDTFDDIDKFLEGVSSGPTRELTASPDWVGSLRKSTALKALASVSDDLMEALKQIRNQLVRFSGLNSTWVYMLLGLNAILTSIVVYFVVQITNAGTASIPPDVLQKIDAIYYNIMGSPK